MINNHTISKNSWKGSRSIFSYLSVQGSYFKKFVLNDVKYIENQLSGKLFSFQNRYSYLVDGQGDHLHPPVELLFSHISIKNNKEAVDTTFLYFSPLNDVLITFNCLQLVESYILKIEDLVLEDNIFLKDKDNLFSYEGSLFQIKESQISISNSIIKKNVFDKISFLNLDERPSTIFFYKNQVIGNQFDDSTFLDGDYSTPHNPCSAMGDTLTSPTPLFHKYTFVLESLFSGNQLRESTLMDIDNGFFAVHGNQFVDMDLHMSQFIVSTFSPIVLDDETDMYDKSPLLEALTLVTFESAWKDYNETIKIGKSYELDLIGCFSCMETNLNVSQQTLRRLLCYLALEVLEH